MLPEVWAYLLSSVGIPLFKCGHASAQVRAKDYSSVGLRLRKYIELNNLELLKERNLPPKHPNRRAFSLSMHKRRQHRVCRKLCVVGVLRQKNRFFESILSFLGLLSVLIEA